MSVTKDLGDWQGRPPSDPGEIDDDQDELLPGEGVVHMITTPAALSVRLPCPSCGAIEVVRATLRSRVVKDQDGTGHLALRCRSPKAAHVCGQETLGLEEGARER